MRKVVQINEKNISRIVSNVLNEVLDEYGDWKAQMLASPENLRSGQGVDKANSMFQQKYNLGDKPTDDNSGYGKVDRYQGTVTTRNNNGQFNTTDVHNKYGINQNGAGVTSQGEYDLHNNAKNDMADFYSGNYKNRLQQKAQMLGNAKSGQDFTPKALKESVNKKTTFKEFLELHDSFFGFYPETPEEIQEMKLLFKYMNAKYKWYLKNRPEEFEEGGMFENCESDYDFFEQEFENNMGEELGEEDEFDELYYDKYFHN